MEIKMHALHYLKYIPGTKEFKIKISNSKTENEFLNIINDIKVYIKNL